MAAIDRLILTGGPGERRIALLAGDEIVDFIIDRFMPGSGDILLGRVLPRPRGLEAAFIEIGDSQPGFLGHPPGKIAEGETLVVQVTAAARRHKGATLSARPTLPGRYLAYDPSRPGVTLSRRILDKTVRRRLTASLTALLAEDDGVVARSAAPDADPAELAAELTRLRAAWRTLEKQAAEIQAPAKLFGQDALEKALRDWPSITRLEVDDMALLASARQRFPGATLKPGCWETSGAADLLDSALNRRVPLAGGGSLIIEETAAATVIDIDGGGGAPAAANRAALPEIARQMRLRALAGHILIDIIPPCGKPEMAALVAELETLLADDPTPTQVIGATRLGMIELTRERRRPSLSDHFLSEPHPRRDPRSLALDALKAAIIAVGHDPTLAPLVTAAPAVIFYLQSRPDLLAETQTRLGRTLALRSQEGRDGFTITEAQK